MLLSIPGLFRMILLILGVLLLVRIINRVAVNKAVQKDKNRFQKEKEESQRNEGKVKLTQEADSDAEDVDYEEVD